MEGIKLISECFVKPKHEVEVAKQPYHLSPIDIVMLSIHPIQKGLLFTLSSQPISSTDRTRIVSNLLAKLKNSLAIALVHFYPLAGRFVTQTYPDEHASLIYVDCVNGPGVRLIHANALHVTVSDILSSTDIVPTYVQSMFELGEKWINYDGHRRALVSIQVTELIDGVFIGFTMNHSVVDGTSFIHFVTMLSEIYKSQGNDAGESCTSKISRVPVFNYKPWVVDDDDVEVLKLPYLEPEKHIEPKFETNSLRVRLFNFSPATMAVLKAKANEKQGTHNVISSFQALCAFVWRSITRARNLPSDQSTTISILINTRSRFNPRNIITDDYVGNFIGAAKVDCNVGELLSHGLGWSAMNLNKEIVSQDRKKIIDMYKMFAKSPIVVNNGEKDFHGSNKVVIGGSARFNMYGPEFGLGRAVATRMGFGNKDDGKVTANPGCGGVGSVELEICLMPYSMAALESDSEFMSMVSLS